MIHQAPAVLLLACIVGAACHDPTAEAEKRKDAAMPDNTLQVLTSSTDRNELYAAAASLLQSPDAADHARLLPFLSKESFLGRLDSPEDYQQGSKYLRISRLIKAMRGSQSPSVRQLLADLAQQREFLANYTRVELLIWASVVIRPAPPPVVKFWDEHCQTGDCFNGLATKAMADNGSQPAIDLLEKKLADASFEDDERIWWMRTAVLTHRNDVPVLMACQRLLAGTLAEALRPELVAVLFDYRPVQWHGPDGRYPAPPLEQASPEARQCLRGIGQHALANVALDARQKKAVEDTLKRLDDLDKGPQPVPKEGAEQDDK